jgi:hypothetical protein
METTHLILAGAEERRSHLAGLLKFKADRVVLFSASTGDAGLPSFLDSIGVPYRSVQLKDGYLDAYLKASYEAAAVFTKQGAVGINMSTGPALSRTAMEDAIRIQLYHFLHHTSTDEVSAFKYFVGSGEEPQVSVAPIWDFATYLHNDIFEILISTQTPVTLAQIHRALSRVMGREAPKWEAFRKTFREFKRAFKGSPCFVEVVGKGPRYQITL